MNERGVPFTTDYDIHDILCEYIGECDGIVEVSRKGFHVPGLTLRNAYGQGQNRLLMCKVDCFKDDNWNEIIDFDDLMYYINKYGENGSYFKKDCRC